MVLNEQNTLKKLLAVDDDLQFLRSLETVLNTRAQVRSVSSRESFIDAYRLEKFDAIITDYKMNLWNGIELIEYVKAQDAALPIILVSGVADKAMAIKCANMQVHRIIEKPLQLSELHEAVDSAFAGAGNRSKFRAVTYGPLRLIEDNFRVENNSLEIQLTETEFQILKILAENVEQRIDRKVFQAKLWGQNRVSEHTFDTHLLNLKKKVPLLKTLIKNIRGYGYLLSAYKNL